MSRRQLFFTFIVTLLCTAITYFGWGLSHAYSAFVGGAIGIIPNFVFALYAFRYAGASASKQVFDSITKGAKVKMLLTALFFGLAFKFLTLSVVPLFTTYILAIATPLVYVTATKFTFNQQ